MEMEKRETKLEARMLVICLWLFGIWLALIGINYWLGRIAAILAGTP